MSKAADLVGRMERMGAATAAPNAIAPPPAPPPPPAAAPAARRNGAVRITFDLSPELHRTLKIYALDRRAAASDVVRALVELLDDPMVSAAVAEVLDRG